MLDDGGRLRSCCLGRGSVSGDQGGGGRAESRSRKGRGVALAEEERTGVEMTGMRASRLGLWLQKRGGRLCLTRCGKAGWGLVDGEKRGGEPRGLADHR